MGDERGIQFDRTRNGSLYDRGGADAYYQRRPNPHWYPNGTYKGNAVTDLTPAEVAEYWAGYNKAVEEGDVKDWGDDCEGDE
jgi:hypothetical protein